jgi:hypothetical protein
MASIICYLARRNHWVEPGLMHMDEGRGVGRKLRRSDDRITPIAAQIRSG